MPGSFPNLADASTHTEARERGLTRYWTGVPCIHGHLAHRWTASRECVECVKARNHRDDRKQYMAAYMRTRRAADPELREAERLSSLERMRTIYAPIYRTDPQHIERQRANQREHYKRSVVENPDRWRRKRRIDYQRLVSTIQGRILCRLRARFHGVLKGKRKPGQCLELVGCSLGELTRHIESQFKAGMSWDNFGEWHIDHIRPCASFDLTEADQVKQCFHFSNLQPLWAIENLKKGATYNG